jgi:hypothetical protein
MKFFVAEYTQAVEGENAEQGEPVMPAICVGHGPVEGFLGLVSYKPAPGATIKELPECDPDELLENLQNKYKGLPEDLLEQYLVGTLTLAQKLKEGGAYSATVTRKDASVMDRGAQITRRAWSDLDPASFI